MNSTFRLKKNILISGTNFKSPLAISHGSLKVWDFFQQKCLTELNLLGCTRTGTPKFNTAPEKWCLEDDPFLLGWQILR